MRDELETSGLAAEAEPSSSPTDARLRYATRYYELIISTSPARIERLGVDPAGAGRYLGVVNNFGPKGSAPFASYGSSLKLHEDCTFEAGRPRAISQNAREVVLRDIPVGPYGLTATWTFRLDAEDFEMQLDWCAEEVQESLWEVGWKLDGMGRHIGDECAMELHSGYRPNYRARSGCFTAWWEDDPRYEHTLVAALLSGTADRGDAIYVEPNDDRPVSWAAWLAISCAGGTSLARGERFSAGRWRIGASGQASDLSYAHGLASREVSMRSECMAAPVAQSSRLVWNSGTGHANLVAECAGGVTRLLDGSWILKNEGLVVDFALTDDASYVLTALDSSGSGLVPTLVGGPRKRYVSVAAANTGDALDVVSETGSGNNLATTHERWELLCEPIRIHVDSLDSYGSGPPAGLLHSYLAYPGGKSKSELENGYDTVISPHLRPRADLIIGQHSMRSPAVGVQSGTSWVALVPDLLIHRQHGNYGIETSQRSFGLGLDIDVANRLVDGAVLAFGWATVEWTYSLWHVEEGYFCRANSAQFPARQKRTAYNLLIGHDAVDQGVVGETQRFLWGQIGNRYFQKSLLPQVQGSDAAFEQAWRWGAELYESRTLGERRVGAVRVDREFPPDAMFMTWFNSLRTAYGIYSQGRARSNADLMSVGRSTLDLLLSAPRDTGAFPTIVRFGADRLEWFGSHKNFANQMSWGPDSYNTFDMGWAAYWVLRWYQDLQEDSTALSFACDYGDFLVGVQLTSGAIPSWLRMRDMKVDPHLRESAQTSASVLFLSELAIVTGTTKYRHAAELAAGYLVANHVRVQRWDDYEVFYSNAPKSESAADPISGISAQDTLSMHLAASGLLSLWRLTGDDKWLAEGQLTLDQLIQYQAVWPATFLSLYTFGGFSAQNTDQEWLDARQAQFAPTLLDYARATGRADYAERGIAALRASYATMCTPSGEAANPRYFDYQPVGWANENYAHNPYDAPTTPVPTPHFDWGVGSALAAWAEVRNRFGDVWLMGSRRIAFGIDNVFVTDVEVTESAISMSLRSPDGAARPVLRAHDLAGESYVLTVNGSDCGRFSAEELASGVAVRVDSVPRIVHNALRGWPPLAGVDYTVVVRLIGDIVPGSGRLCYRDPAGEWLQGPLVLDPSGRLIGVIPGEHLVSGRRAEYFLQVDGEFGSIFAPEVDPSAVPYTREVT